MTHLWFSIDDAELNRACGRMEWAGLLWIGAGVIGLLFGMFWIVFGFMCIAIDVGPLVYILLIIVGGGVGPVIGATVVTWVGISRRVTAARLREIRTMAHGVGGVSQDQVRIMLRSQRGAERLLRRACEMGIAAPAVPKAAR